MVKSPKMKTIFFEKVIFIAISHTFSNPYKVMGLYHAFVNPLKLTLSQFTLMLKNIPKHKKNKNVNIKFNLNFFTFLLFVEEIQCYQ